MSDLGLSIAVSALIAQQDSLNVTSQNIANANTTGYSREQAEEVTNPSIPVPGLNSSGSPGQFGTGVDVQAVTRTATSSWTPSTGSRTCCWASPSSRAMP